MMQRRAPHPPPPLGRGTEGWLPPLIVAITSLALVIALVWFIVVVHPLRERISMPKQTIPAAIVVAAILSLGMLYRAFRALRIARAGWTHRKSPPPQEP